MARTKKSQLRSHRCLLTLAFSIVGSDSPDLPQTLAEAQIATAVLDFRVWKTWLRTELYLKRGKWIEIYL